MRGGWIGSGGEVFVQEEWGELTAKLGDVAIIPNQTRAKRVFLSLVDGIHANLQDPHPDSSATQLLLTGSSTETGVIDHSVPSPVQFHLPIKPRTKHSISSKRVHAQFRVHVFPLLLEKYHIPGERWAVSNPLTCEELLKYVQKASRTPRTASASPVRRVTRYENNPKSNQCPFGGPLSQPDAVPLPEHSPFFPDEEGGQALWGEETESENEFVLEQRPVQHLRPGSAAPPAGMTTLAEYHRPTCTSPMAAMLNFAKQNRIERQNNGSLVDFQKKLEAPPKAPRRRRRKKKQNLAPLSIKQLMEQDPQPPVLRESPSMILIKQKDKSTGGKFSPESVPGGLSPKTVLEAEEARAEGKPMVAARRILFHRDTPKEPPKHDPNGQPPIAGISSVKLARRMRFLNGEVCYNEDIPFEQLNADSQGSALNLVSKLTSLKHKRPNSASPMAKPGKAADRLPITPAGTPPSQATPRADAQPAAPMDGSKRPLSSAGPRRGQAKMYLRAKSASPMRTHQTVHTPPLAHFGGNPPLSGVVKIEGNKGNDSLTSCLLRDF